MSSQDAFAQELIKLLTPLDFRGDSNKHFDPASWYNTPGVSVAVGTTVTKTESTPPAPSASVFDTYHTATWGAKHLDTPDSAVDTDTLFQACSVSKAFQSLAVLHYVSEGVITSLDDPIKWYLSETTYKTLVGTAAARGVPYELSATLVDTITITQLLAHVAGTTGSGFWGYPISADNQQPVVTSTQALLGGFSNKANSTPVYINSVPGLQYNYSGGGSTILQAMLEHLEARRAAEQSDEALSYAALMKAKVLAPLGMTRSLYCDAAPLAHTERNYARGYQNGHVALETGKYHVHPEQGAAGLWTTPADLVKGMAGFVHTLLGTTDAIHLPDGKAWIRPDVAQEILRKRGELAHGESAYYCGFNIEFFDDATGDGWYNEKDKGSVRISHAGGNWGYRCWAAAVFPYSPSDHHDNKDNSTVTITAHAVMTNSNCGGEIIAPTVHAISQHFDAPLDFGKLGKSGPFSEFPPAIAMDPEPRLPGSAGGILGWDAFEGEWDVKGRAGKTLAVVVTAGVKSNLAVRFAHLGGVEVPLYAVAARQGKEGKGRGEKTWSTVLRAGPLDVVLEFGWRVTGEEKKVALTMYTCGSRIECTKV